MCFSKSCEHFMDTFEKSYYGSVKENTKEQTECNIFGQFLAT